MKIGDIVNVYINNKEIGNAVMPRFSFQGLVLVSFIGGSWMFVHKSDIRSM